MMRARLVSRIARLIREDSAAAMVEFAIVVSLLLVIAFGTIDWARYFLTRAMLTNVVRDAARYGATLGANPDTATVSNYLKAEIDSLRFPGLSKDSGQIAYTKPGASGATRLRVQLSNYPFKPYTLLVIKSTKRMTISAEFRQEIP